MGDHESFVKLIQEYEGLIYKVSSLYTSNRETTQDLYQEIVLQLWKSLSSFKGGSKISTWIYRVSLNTAITYMRKPSSKIKHIPLDWDIVDEQDDGKQERLGELYHRIKQLNHLEKGIVLLYLEEHSYEEISQVLGITVSNVATRLSRIRKKLKKEIQG